MKLYLLFVVLALLFAACTTSVSFNVEAPQIKGGSFFIKNQEDSIVFSKKIINGRMKLDKPMMEQSGYYKFEADAYDAPPGNVFDIYVEPGSYNIRIRGNKYPLISSTSKRQQELSAYYAIFQQEKTAANNIYKQYNRNLKKNGEAMPINDYTALANKVSESYIATLNVENAAFLKYIKQYPQSIIAAHLLAGINYEDDPVTFYRIFNGLSKEARDSDEGIAMAKVLNRLIALAPGKTAPLIQGTTPDGKTFNAANLNKKIYLLEFWKSANVLSRTNHLGFDTATMHKVIPDIKNMGMISISLDHKRDWWTHAVKEDKLYWSQYSDLRGNESPNGLNWNINHLPTYYLLNSKWQIIKADLQLDELPSDINQYLAHH